MKWYAVLLLVIPILIAVSMYIIDDKLFADERARAARAGHCQSSPERLWFSYNPKDVNSSEVLEYQSLYVTMEDGVKLAVDVVLPRSRTQEKFKFKNQSEKLPTIIHSTRYMRSLELRLTLSLRGSLDYLLALIGQGLGFGPDHAYFSLFGGRHRIKRDPVHMFMQGARETFVQHGYAWVDLDARGSGASFGSRDQALGPQETSDAVAIVDWIIKQPWSNGRIGALGSSYMGLTAETLAQQQHKHVVAVAPLYAPFDVFTEYIRPGGVYLKWFGTKWGETVAALDRNDLAALAPFWTRWLIRHALGGVRRVDEDIDGSMLKEALVGHLSNWDVTAATALIRHRDDTWGEKKVCADQISPHGKVKQLAEAGIPVLSESGWVDAANPHAAIKRFNTLVQLANGVKEEKKKKKKNDIEKTMHRLVLGPWQHGGRFSYRIDTGKAVKTCYDHELAYVRFFDEHVKQLDTGLSQELPVHYYTMGEEKWHASESFPPKGISYVEYTMKSSGSLGSMTETATEVTSVAHDVTDPEVVSTGTVLGRIRADGKHFGSGYRSRWNSLVEAKRPVDYRTSGSFRRLFSGGSHLLFNKHNSHHGWMEDSLLTFVSEPFTKDRVVTGFPSVRVVASFDNVDTGAIFCYLVYLPWNGRQKRLHGKKSMPVYLTEGMISAKFIKESIPESEMPYWNVGDASTNRLFNRLKEEQKLRNSSIAVAHFHMLPISVKIPKNGRLAMVIAGMDTDLFAHQVPGDIPVKPWKNTIYDGSMLYLPFETQASTDSEH